MRIKITSFICALFLCSTLSWAQTWQLTPTITAELAGNTMTIYGTGDMPDYDPVDNAPPWYNALMSASIQIRAAAIKYGITSIGNYTFSDCYSLASIAIPDGVKSIGESAFRGCYSLTSVTIPNSVMSIGYSAFFDCLGLISVTIPGGVTSIGNSAFGYCTSLTSVTVEWANPLPITDVVFENVDLSAATLYVPYGAKALYEVADVWKNFGTISEVKTWQLTPTITATLVDGTLTISGTGAMPDYGYQGSPLPPSPWTENLDVLSVVIENGVTRIGSLAFSNCTYLASITIPDGVTSIGESAFDCCYGLKSVTIPNSVTSIGEGAFYRCTTLASVTVEWANPLSIPDLVFNGSGFDLATLHVPEGTKALYEAADVWNSFGTIIDDALVPVTSVSIVAAPGEDLPEVGQTLQLLAIVYPENATNKAVTWSSSNTGIAEVNATGLVTAKAAGTVTITVTTVDGGKTDEIELTLTTNGPCPNPAASGTAGPLVWTLCPDGTLTISGTGAMPDYGYQGSPLPGSPWTRNLDVRSVVIENGVTNIGDGAFYYCESLASITIPNSVKSIGYGAFYYCTNLASATIPNGVTSIGGDAFKYCMKLASVSIPNGVTSIGRAAFQFCLSLESVTIPNSVTSIEEYTFTNCSSLTSIIIPSSVTSIGNGAFADCYGLASVTIQNSVASIGNRVFADCKSLTSVTVEWANPLSIPDDVFKEVYMNVDLSAATLHVPAGTKALYEATDIWKNFGTIVEQAVAAEEVEPVATTNAGSIELSLNLPTGATLTGSFNIKLPEGMALDEGNTKLVEALASSFKLLFQELANNVWTITIEANTTRSLLRDATLYTKVMDIAYTVAPSVTNGNYTIQLSDIALVLKESGGMTSSIQEPSLPVTVQVNRTTAVTGVTLNKTSLTVTLGDAPATLVATVAPADATNKDVTWSTSNANVATVNNGVVTFTGVGTATITVTTVDGSQTATCTVVVTAPTSQPNPTVYVTGVSLNHTTLTAKAGDAAVSLVATITPTNATNKGVTWSTSNPLVATVNDGTVSFIGAGTATITVTTSDGAYTATCVVTVSTTTGAEGVDATLKVYLRDYILYVCSPAAETIEVYSFSGAKLFSARKGAGDATFTVPTNLKAVIVRGSSGWTKKMGNN